MANSKKSNKNKPASTNFASLTPNQYVKQRARKLPFVTAFVNPNYRDEGLAVVAFIKKQGGDKFLWCTFVTDVYCLGIKNSVLNIGLTESEYKTQVEDHYNRIGLPYVEIDTNTAQNIIWGSFEYAADLGFQPKKDSEFDVMQYILDPIDEIEFVDIEFGKEGKPFFINGPYDNVAKVLATLNKSVGRGNYDYIARIESDEVETYKEQGYTIIKEKYDNFEEVQ